MQLPDLACYFVISSVFERFSTATHSGEGRGCLLVETTLGELLLLFGICVWANKSSKYRGGVVKQRPHLWNPVNPFLQVPSSVPTWIILSRVKCSHVCSGLTN